MKKKTVEQQLRAEQQNWYDYMNTTQVKLKLNNKTDADILKWLHSLRYREGTTMQGEIKRLIRQEIQRTSS